MTQIKAAANINEMASSRPAIADIPQEPPPSISRAAALATASQIAIGGSLHARASGREASGRTGR